MDTLKKTVRKKIVETQKNKKNLITESKIVNTRFSLLIENSSFDTKNDLDLFAKNLINEIIYLNSQNLNKQIIEESFFDMIGGFFKGLGGGAWEYIWEQIADWLLNELGLKPGFLRDAISVWVGNVNFVDVPKMLTDCNFLVKSLTGSLAETYVKKLQKEYVGQGPFYDTLRNSLTTEIKEGGVYQAIERTLTATVCPLINGLTPKMENVTKAMKGGALNAVTSAK
jgi:hypothetical protein